MDPNMLQINPYQAHPILEITGKICQILDKHHSPTSTQHIQIEFKYAQLIAFTNSYFVQQPIQNTEIKKKVIEVCAKYVGEQNALHLASIKKLSCYNLVLMNVFGPRVYKLCGGFKEEEHKRFYKMRDFLEKLCLVNRQNFPDNKLNFYKDIQKIGLNRTLKMFKQSEIRLDVNVKQGQKAGRYSYCVGQGWTKTNKENLIREQFDLMMAQRTFRLGIKKQQQIEVSFDEVLAAMNQANSQKGGIFLRVKRAMRVIKNNEVQIALSQIYQPQQQRRNQMIQDIKDMLLCQPSILDQFSRNVFQQFYMYQPKSDQIKQFQDSVCKYEIESQYTRNGIKKLRELQKQSFTKLSRYIQNTLQDLYALYFVDHNVKKRQALVFGKLIKYQQENGAIGEGMGNGEGSGGKNEERGYHCRLQNQFGGYMHDLLFQYMTHK